MRRRTRTYPHPSNCSQKLDQITAETNTKSTTLKDRYSYSLVKVHFEFG